MNLYSYANLGLWNRILFLRGSAEQRKQSCLDECAAGITRRCAVCFPSGCAVLRGSHSLPLSTAL